MFTTVPVRLVDKIECNIFPHFVFVSLRLAYTESIVTHIQSKTGRAMLLFDLALLFGLELKLQAFVALFCVLGVISFRSEHFSLVKS